MYRFYMNRMKQIRKRKLASTSKPRPRTTRYTRADRGAYHLRPEQLVSCTSTADLDNVPQAGERLGTSSARFHFIAYLEKNHRNNMTMAFLNLAIANIRIMDTSMLVRRSSPYIGSRYYSRADVNFYVSNSGSYVTSLLN